jgi:4'-phosphopantetheinyl transferase EntD
MAEPGEIEALLVAAFGARARVAAVEITAEPQAFVDSLYDEELRTVENAVQKRKNEFAAGRWLARRLLGELGFDPGPLLALADRSVAWPEGAVGSISHTQGLCAVVVARKHDAVTVGIDVEKGGPLKRDLWRMILRDEEQAWIESYSADEIERGTMAKLFFSAKECFYKCQYTVTRTFLEFHDVELAINPARGRFRVRVLHPCGRQLGDPAMLEGFYFIEERWVVSGMLLAALPISSP